MEWEDWMVLELDEKGFWELNDWDCVSGRFAVVVAVVVGLDLGWSDSEEVVVSVGGLGLESWALERVGMKLYTDMWRLFCGVVIVGVSLLFGWLVGVSTATRSDTDHSTADSVSCACRTTGSSYLITNKSTAGGDAAANKTAATIFTGNKAFIFFFNIKIIYLVYLIRQLCKFNHTILETGNKVCTVSFWIFSEHEWFSTTNLRYIDIHCSKK